MIVKRKPDIEALKAARREEKRKSGSSVARTLCRQPPSLRCAALVRAEKALETESQTVTYKVVNPGSGTWKTWKTVTEKVDGGMSREDMLQRRAKEKADRFCK